MQILDAFDLTGSLRDAAELAGCDHHTVARYVAARDNGGLARGRLARDQLIDPHLAKLEEWVERSRGKLRADVAHDKLVALGYRGSERTTRRAVAAAKQAFMAGHRRVHRPWVPEPGMWFQWDYGTGPLVAGRQHSCLRVAGVEPLPGRAPDRGQDPADGDRLHRSGAAPVRRGADLRAHR